MSLREPDASEGRPLSGSTRPRTLVALIAGAVLGFCGALTGGVLADRPNEGALPAHPARPVGGTALPWQEGSLFAEVYERIKRDYVDDVDDHELMEKAVRGMVAALDPHSAFLDSEEFEEIRLSNTGFYPGIGIEVVAEEAGMLAGDFIVKSDGVEVGSDLAGAINRMRGPAGSTVRLTVRRPAHH